MTFTYEIYQLPVESDLIFRDWSFVKGRVPRFEKNWKTIYKKTYEGTIESERGLTAVEELFEKFNIDRPDDFKGHSLSVSDIIVLNGEYTYYCDSCLWQRIS